MLNAERVSEILQRYEVQPYERRLENNKKSKVGKD